VHGARDGAFKTDGVHGHAEALAVFRLVDDIGLGADHLHIEQLQHAALVELQRAIQRGLSAHGGQKGVGAFLLDHLGDHFRRDRLDIGGVGQIGVGHDRGRVGVHQDHPVALFLERFHRLNARIVKLAGLADHDGAGADDQDGLDVCALGHGRPLKVLHARAKTQPLTSPKRGGGGVRR
jgi:hypothetical protein